MGLRISFFNTPSHRVFNYRPRYYDETKEHIRELEEKYGKTEGAPQEEKRYIPGAAIQRAYREGLEGQRRSSDSGKVKKLIILLSILAAMIAAYYLAQGLAEMLL